VTRDNEAAEDSVLGGASKPRRRMAGDEPTGAVPAAETTKSDGFRGDTNATSEGAPQGVDRDVPTVARSSSKAGCGTFERVSGGVGICADAGDVGDCP
jgi:hypothetical protein